MKSNVLYKESKQCAPPSKDYVSLSLTTEKLTIHRFRIRLIFYLFSKIVKFVSVQPIWEWVVDQVV